MSLYIGIFLIAFSISPLSVMLTEKYIGPNLVEPFFFLGLFLILKDYKMRMVIKRVIHSLLFKISIVVIFFQMVVGIASTSEIAYVYADFRTNLLLIFSFLLFQQKSILTNHNGIVIKSLLWAIIIMDLIYSLLYFSSVLSGTQHHVRIRMVSPISIVLLMYLYLFVWSNINLSFLLFLLMSYHTIVSAMRNFYIIFFISLIILILGLFQNRTNKVHKAIIIAILFIIPIYTWQRVYDFWMSDGSRQVHSINRVEETIKGQNKETERFNSVTIPFTDVIYHTYPKGIGWRGYVNDIQKRYGRTNLASTMDSGFYYIAFHYGLFVFMILLALVTSKFINVVKQIRRLHRMVWFALFILFITAFFTQGTMFAYITFSFNYGMLLAFLSKSFYYESAQIHNIQERIKDLFVTRNLPIIISRSKNILSLDKNFTT